VEPSQQPAAEQLPSPPDNDGRPAAATRSRSRSRSHSRSCGLPRWLRSRSRSGSSSGARPDTYRPTGPSPYRCGENASSADASTHGGSAPLCHGAGVRLHGLRAAAHLNGLEGTAGHWIPETKRWEVRLLGSGEVKSVKPDNLIALAPAASSSRALLESPPATEGRSIAGNSAGESRLTAKLRKVSGGDEARLAFLSAVVSTRLETGVSFERADLRHELAPLLTGAPLEELLDVVECERGRPVASLNGMPGSVFSAAGNRDSAAHSKPSVSGAPVAASSSSLTGASPHSSHRSCGSQSAHPPSNLFEARLEKLRERAEKEDRVVRKGKSKGKGRVDFRDSVLLEPVAFVSAKDPPSDPSRKVVVIDPRRARRDGEDNSDSDSDSLEPPHFCITPPIRGTTATPPCDQWYSRLTPMEGPSAAEKTVDMATCFEKQGAVLSGHVAQPNSVPGCTEQQMGSPPAAPGAPAAATMPVQHTLLVSDAARKDEQAVKDNREKRRALDENKKKILERLTQQLQLCLSKLQGPQLDDQGREKYQDIIQSIKGQMAKVSDIP